MATQSRRLQAIILGSALALSLQAQSTGPGSSSPPVGFSGSALPDSVTHAGGGLANEGRRPLYITGVVMMDDGGPPPEPVALEIACGGKAKPYGVTDSTGAFSINYGQPESYAMGSSDFSGVVGGNVNNTGSGRIGSAGSMIGCSLSARLPGFSSDPVQLNERRQIDNPNLGTIVLHRLANASGFTFSMTTMNAPKNARKDYEKGVETAKKAKWPEAEGLFRKAVAAYPEYAVSWEALGRTLEMEKRPAEAKKAYEESVRADPRFVTPYMRLMVLSGREQRWDEVAKSAAAVIQLDPSSYPLAYFFSGIANLNLNREDEAEKIVRAGLKVDSHGTVPRLNHLMGTLLLHRGAYADALPYLRAYLQNQPESADAATVKGVIAQAEKLTATPGPGAAVR